jgi:transposase
VLETFAAGLTQDRTAVRAALTTSWTNAQAEGQISRLKMLKRTMYDRASFALLRRRILIAA